MKPNPGPATPWDAASYHAVSGPQESWGVELAEEFSWRGDERVLDAGCGSGRLTARLLDFVPRGKVIAVDSDSGMLAEARRTLAAPIAAGKIELHESSLLDFTTPRPVDVVFSNAVFHWMDDHPALWRKCFSWLRPGGWLWAQAGGEGNLRPQLEVAAEIAREERFRGKLADVDRGHHHAAAPEPTQRLLAEAGFTEIRSFLTTKEPRFEDAAALQAFVRTVILRPYRDRLGLELYDPFVRAWTKLHMQRHGPKLDYVRLNVMARRPPLRH